jgi:hypothetical protein
MLCINKNILKNCLNKIDKHEQFDYSMKEANQLLCISIETSFNGFLVEFRNKFAKSRGADEYIISNVVPLK